MLPNICYEQEISCKNCIDSKEVQHAKFTIDMAVEEIKQWKVVCSKIILYIALSLQIKPKQVFLCILIDPNYILAPEVFYQMQFYLVELL